MTSALRLISVLMILLSLTACITEQISGRKRTADPVKYLQALIDLGIGYLRNGEYQRSKEKLLLAIEQDPKSSTAHTTLGLLYQLQREEQLAEKHFKKAIRYDSGHSQARLNYGAFLFQQKQYKEAVKQLTRAASDNSYRGQPEALENLGVCYLQMGDSKKAEESFLRALGLNSQLKRALLEMSEMRIDELKYAESNRYYRAYLKVSQQTAQSLWLGIRLARIFGNKDEESSYGLLLKSVFPTSREYKMYKAGIL